MTKSPLSQLQQQHQQHHFTAAIVDAAATAAINHELATDDDDIADTSLIIWSKKPNRTVKMQNLKNFPKILP